MRNVMSRKDFDTTYKNLEATAKSSSSKPYRAEQGTQLRTPTYTTTNSEYAAAVQANAYVTDA